MNKNIKRKHQHLSLAAIAMPLVILTGMPADFANAQSNGLGWVKVTDEHASFDARPIPINVRIVDPLNPNSRTRLRGRSKIGSQLKCQSVQLEQVDPIVSPGDHHAHHLHEFFGNPNVTENTTTQSLADTPASAIECDNKNDRSAYWTPAVYQNDKIVRAHKVQIYYRSPNPNTVPMPLGLRMIAGNASATRNQDKQVGRWQANTRVNTAGKNRMIRTRNGEVLKLRMIFPSCWDGEHLDSPDHQSHMAYPEDQVCPPSHPVAVPKIGVFIHYRAQGGKGFRLASGPWYTFHMDFWNAWSPPHFKAMHARCNLKEKHCAPNKDSNIVVRR